MKEDLVDYDGKTRLFKNRTAANFGIPLSALEFGFYKAALDMVDQFFPPVAPPLARMVYCKRAASTLEALARTLQRRHDHMGEKSEAEAVMDADREFSGDEAETDEARVVHAGSTATRAERAAVKELISQIRSLSSDWRPSKWKRLIEDCFATNGILPGNAEQAVVFTEYADSAEWIAERLKSEGFTARVYSGRQTHGERDEIRLAFMRGDGLRPSRSLAWPDEESLDHPHGSPRSEALVEVALRRAERPEDPVVQDQGLGRRRVHDQFHDDRPQPERGGLHRVPATSSEIALPGMRAVRAGQRRHPARLLGPAF